jgi:hypothetical protein
MTSTATVTTSATAITTQTKTTDAKAVPTDVTTTTTTLMLTALQSTTVPLSDDTTKSDSSVQATSTTTSSGRLEGTTKSESPSQTIKAGKSTARPDATRSDVDTTQLPLPIQEWACLQNKCTTTYTSCIMDDDGCGAILRDTQAENRVPSAEEKAVDSTLSALFTCYQDKCFGKFDPAKGKASSSSKKKGSVGGVIAGVLIVVVLFAIVVFMFVKRSGPFSEENLQPPQSFSNPMYDTAESAAKAKTASPQEIIDPSPNVGGYMDLPATESDERTTVGGGGYLDVEGSSHQPSSEQTNGYAFVGGDADSDEEV